MKICLIADGLSLHTQRWANYFVRQKHEVHLISSRFPEDDSLFDTRIFKHQLTRLFPKIWRVTGYVSGLLWLFEVRKLVKIIKQDILNAHFITICGYLGVAARYHPFILTAWGSDVLIAPKNSFIHKLLTVYSLKKADLIISLSPTMIEELIELGANNKLIKTALLGVDTNLFAPTASINLIRKQLNLPVLSPIVISTRNLEYIYDIVTLIKAIHIVRQTIPDIVCIIMGDGSQRAYLEKLTEKLNIKTNIRFIGKVQHDCVSKYLTGSDIYVSTSLSDGASNALLEAMACGLPVIVSDIKANNWWVEEDKNGYLFPAQDYHTLAKKIINLINDKNKRLTYGKFNRSSIIKKAEYKANMAHVEHLYASLINNHNACL